MKTPDGKDTNVLSKTPEEIKKGILCDGPCGECAYRINIMSDGGCSRAVADDTIALIEQLERERDAAVEELKGYGCTYCKRLEEPDESMCGEKCADFCNWEWRGVKEKNDG